MNNTTDNRNTEGTRNAKQIEDTKDPRGLEDQQH